MRRVIIESPWDGNTKANFQYLKDALRDAITRDESPYASHGLIAALGILRDDVPGERALGIKAGLAWRTVADASCFYTDMGWSPGMYAAYKSCKAAGLPFEVRAIRGILIQPPD